MSSAPGTPLSGFPTWATSGSSGLSFMWGLLSLHKHVRGRTQVGDRDVDCVLEVHSAHDTSDGGFVSALGEIQFFDQALINQAGC